MTPDKQKLYDAFMAGHEITIEVNDTTTDDRQRFRGYFEEWLDEREASVNRGVVCEPNEEMRRALGIDKSPFRSNLS